ncbi:MAG: family 10 glycosylhydrolase, partial [Thermoactinomyces sp.]
MGNRSFWRKASVFIFSLMLLGMPNIPPAHAVDRGISIPQETTWKKRQLRALWVASVVNIDWPSAPGLPIEKQQQELIQILDDAKELNMNAVVVQIRPTADAFYPSKLNPWSKYLTGTQGKDPGYDPLAFMIREAHKRNLEFHAWFNPYRVSMDTNIDQLAPNNVARLHPDWVRSYGGKLYLDPGLPEVRRYIIDSVMEVVKKYDIDAVHFDDYFYPYPVSGVDFPDQETYEKYGANYADKGDWRRHNVNLLVQELSRAIKKEKPYVKFGISPFGIWRNQTTDPTGSDTNGLQSYDSIYCDTRTWINEGWVDYVAPQIYWNFGYAPASYEKLVDWWANEVKGKNVHLYIGQAAYKIGHSIAAWDNPEEMPNQLKYNNQFDEVKGSIFFSYKDVKANYLGFRDRLKNDLFKYPALVPTMPWLDDQAPKKPKLLSAASTGDSSVHLVWKDRSEGETATFAIYRFADQKEIDLNQPQNLIATVRKNGNGLQTFDDQTAEGKPYVYVITALDRLH